MSTRRALNVTREQDFPAGLCVGDFGDPTMHAQASSACDCSLGRDGDEGDQSSGSMQVRILSCRYSSSRKPYARR